MTTKQTKATERPWRISSSVVVVNEVGKVVAMPMMGVDSLEVPLEEMIANAELICEAINAHDALMDALRDINTLANNEGEQPGFSLKAQAIVQRALNLVGDRA